MYLQIVSNILIEQACLCRYPRLTLIHHWWLQPLKLFLQLLEEASLLATPPRKENPRCCILKFAFVFATWLLYSRQLDFAEPPPRGMRHNWNPQTGRVSVHESSAGPGGKHLADEGHARGAQAA